MYVQYAQCEDYASDRRPVNRIKTWSNGKCVDGAHLRNLVQDVQNHTQLLPMIRFSTDRSVYAIHIRHDEESTVGPDDLARYEMVSTRCVVLEAVDNSLLFIGRIEDFDDERRRVEVTRSVYAALEVAALVRVMTTVHRIPTIFRGKSNTRLRLMSSGWVLRSSGILRWSGSSDMVEGGRNEEVVNTRARPLVHQPPPVPRPPRNER